MNVQNVSDKMKHPLMFKILEKQGSKETFLNIVKWQTHANIILNGEKLKEFPLKWGTCPACLLSHFYSIKSLKLLFIRKENKIKGIQNKKRRGQIIYLLMALSSI